MTADGVYDLDFACVLATDNDPADNALMLSAENYYIQWHQLQWEILFVSDTVVSADEYLGTMLQQVVI